MVKKEIEIDGRLVPFRASAATPEEWLDQFNTFSIYEVLPELLDLWNLNISTDVEAKKKLNQVAGK